MSNALPKLAIVIPCYNESEILPLTLEKLSEYLQTLRLSHKIASDSFLYCVDDGSDDSTWHIISTWHKKHPDIKGLKLTRNVGHQNTILAGLLHVKNKVDCAITIDADLQDDITAISRMLDCFGEGNDIVYGVRQSRHQDSFLKRMTAQIFYKVMKRSGADILYNHADFRLLSNRAILTLSRFKERNLFLRGIFPLMGYPVAKVYYDRTNRTAGESKYTLRKMLALAWDGVTSFSHMPLSFILTLGTISFFLSILMVFFVLGAKFFATTVPGWTSIMIPLCFMGGIQLLSIGIIGEYISKVYTEVKRRPRFIKDEELS
ncbi:MAG: glycosyltransferase family 2 protein [Gammaproteobacteria bacterium]|nr:glycosyltransferase family 2 protein [Gammaproteobacteria bacterium]